MVAILQFAASIIICGLIIIRIRNSERIIKELQKAVNETREALNVSKRDIKNLTTAIKKL